MKGCVVLLLLSRELESPRDRTVWSACTVDTHGPERLPAVLYPVDARLS